MDEFRSTLGKTQGPSTARVGWLCSLTHSARDNRKCFRTKVFEGKRRGLGFVPVGYKEVPVIHQR